MKRGFSLIAAIFFIIIISTVGLLALSYSAMAAKNTGDLFVKEQGKLLAISAAEYAIMAMQSHLYPDYPDRNNNTGTNCLDEVHLSYPSNNDNDKLFDIRVNIYYLDHNLVARGCRANNVIGTQGVSSNLDRHMALLDVNVESTHNVPGEKIRYNRRVLAQP